MVRPGVGSSSPVLWLGVRQLALYRDGTPPLCIELPAHGDSVEDWLEAVFEALPAKLPSQAFAAIIAERPPLLLTHGAPAPTGTVAAPGTGGTFHWRLADAEALSRTLTAAGLRWHRLLPGASLWPQLAGARAYRLLPHRLEIWHDDRLAVHRRPVGLGDSALRAWLAERLPAGAQPWPGDTADLVRTSREVASLPDLSPPAHRQRQRQHQWLATTGACAVCLALGILPFTLAARQEIRALENQSRAARMTLVELEDRREALNEALSQISEVDAQAERLSEFHAACAKLYETLDSLPELPATAWIDSLAIENGRLVSCTFGWVDACPEFDLGSELTPNERHIDAHGVGRITFVANPEATP